MKTLLASLFALVLSMGASAQTTGAASYGGTYNGTTTYPKNAIVTEGGVTYISKVAAVHGVDPAGDTSHASWDVLASPTAATLPPGSPDAVYTFTETSGTTLRDLTTNGRNITLPSSPPALSAQGVTFSSGAQALATPLVGLYKTAQTCWTHTTGQLVSTGGVATDFESVPTFLANTALANSSALEGFDPTSTRVQMGTIFPNVISYSTSTHAYVSADGVAGGPHCITHVRGSSTDAIYLDGKLQTPTTNTGTAGVTPSSAAITLGGTQDGNASLYWFRGTFHNAAIWMTTQLSPEQVARAYAWGLADLQAKGVVKPLSHPQDGLSRIVFVGDSVSECAGVGGPGATCFIDRLTLDDTGLNTRRARAVMPGAPALFAATSAKYRDDTLFDPNAPRNVASIFFGINDGCRYQYSGQEVWQWLVEWSRAKRAKGVKTLVTTMTDVNATFPCGTTSETGSQYKNELNAVIRANWQAEFDGIVDMGSIPAMSCDGCASSGYFSDGVHWSASGNNIAGIVVSEAVNRLTGSTQASPHRLVATTSANTYTMTGADSYLAVVQPASGTAATTALTLPSCFGKTGEVYHIINALRSSDGAVTVLPVSGEALAGGLTSVPAGYGATLDFTSVLITPSTPTCYWQPSYVPPAVTVYGQPTTATSGAVVLAAPAWQSTDNAFTLSFTPPSTTAASTTFVTVTFGKTWYGPSGATAIPSCSFSPFGSPGTSAASVIVATTATTLSLTTTPSQTLTSGQQYVWMIQCAGYTER